MIIYAVTYFDGEQTNILEMTQDKERAEKVLEHAKNNSYDFERKDFSIEEYETDTYDCHPDAKVFEVTYYKKENKYVVEQSSPSSLSAEKTREVMETPLTKSVRVQAKTEEEAIEKSKKLFKEN